MKSKKVIICVTNDLSTDQRVHKVAQSLMAKGGYEVVLVGRRLKSSPDIDRDYATERFRVWINKGPFFYLFYNIRLFIYLIFSNFQIVLSNDLDTLPACKTAAKLKKKKLVYDSHELFTEVPELVARPKIKAIWERIEKKFISNIQWSYTVCEPIADIYKSKYHINMQVIRNLPLKQSQPEIDKFDTPTLIYQGALNMGRGLELMIDVMSYLPDFQLVICGTGYLLKTLQDLCIEKKLTNVNFTGHLDFTALQQMTSQAHIGLSWEENIGKNYYFALPNKLFDYIQARIPVLISDLPAMRQIVDGYNVGKVLSDRNPEKIALQIRAIYTNRHTFAEALEEASHELCWEKEERKLLEIFNQIV